MEGANAALITLTVVLSIPSNGGGDSDWVWFGRCGGSGSSVIGLAEVVAGRHVYSRARGDTLMPRDT